MKRPEFRRSDQERCKTLDIRDTYIKAAAQPAGKGWGRASLRDGTKQTVDPQSRSVFSTKVGPSGLRNNERSGRLAAAHLCTPAAC